MPRNPTPQPTLTIGKPIFPHPPPTRKKNLDPRMYGGIFLPPTCRINYIFQYARKVVFIFSGVIKQLNCSTILKNVMESMVQNISAPYMQVIFLLLHVGKMLSTCRIIVSTCNVIIICKKNVIKNKCLKKSEIFKNCPHVTSKMPVSTHLCRRHTISLYI